MKDTLFETANPGADERLIRLLEEQFHFQLPPDMKSFYLEHNGGVLSPGVRIAPDGLEWMFFYPIGRQYQEYILTINKLLEWQEMDAQVEDEFIPMCYVPFCADAADDCCYIRVDEEGYGKVYYILSECLDEFLADPEGNGYVAGSFTEFLEKMKISD